MRAAICHESDEVWKAERTNGIGGSDAPQILGISSFGGPAKVAASKLGFHVEDAESELREWGHYVEGPLMDRFHDETGIRARKSGILYRSTDPSTPWLQATIDGEIEGEPGGVQCKHTLYKADDWDEGVPDYVDAQVQHEMAVMGWDWIYVLVLLRGYQFRWAKVERNDAFVRDTLLPAEADFWRRLKADEPIAPLGAPDREWEALKARYPRPEIGKTARLEGVIWVQLHGVWQRAAAEASKAEKEAKGYRNQFVAAMGDAEYALLDDGQRLSLKLTERKGYEVKPTSYRTLRAVGGE